MPASMQLFDIADDGRILLAMAEERMGMAIRGRNDAQERDLSWLDWSLIREISADGSTVFFDETGEGGGDDGVAFLRRGDGSPALRLAEGTASSLSKDGKWVVIRSPEPHRNLVMVPTGAGQPRQLTNDDTNYVWGAVLPDNKRFVMAIFEKSSGSRLSVANLDGTNRRLISGSVSIANAGIPAVSDDGKWIGLRDSASRAVLLPVDGGTPRVVSSVPGLFVLGFSADSKYVFLAPRAVPVTIQRVEIASGHSEPWATIHPTAMPPNGAIVVFRLASDGKSYAYTYNESTATLFLADGLR
jgi:Tol biopolymer transport system component